MQKDIDEMDIEQILQEDSIAAEKMIKEHRENECKDKVRIIKSMDEDSINDTDEPLYKYSVLLNPTQLTLWPESAEWVNTLKLEFPWMESIIKKIEKQSIFSKKLGYNVFKIAPILLVGRPGIGKTYFLRRMSEVLATPTTFLELAGSSDNLMLKGTARNFSHARPGLLLDVMAEKKIGNPLVILDEIDKVSENQRHGRMWETILTMIEPSSSQNIMDECLLSEVDYSHVNWLATANSIKNLPAPLRSRFSIIEVDEPRSEDYDTIISSIRKMIAEKYHIEKQSLPYFDKKVDNELRLRFSKKQFSLRNMYKVMNELFEIEISAGGEEEIKRGEEEIKQEKHRILH